MKYILFILILISQMAYGQNKYIPVRIAQGVQGVQGIPGNDGQEIELQTTATHIQWRYVGGSWTNLIALTAITGPQGPTGLTGSTGATGAAGADGTEIELQTTSTHIQWRYVGGSWVNLVALADITGPQGPPGADGTGSGTVTSITATSPLTGGTITTSGSIGIQTASGSQAGALSSTDWNTFNNKVSSNWTLSGTNLTNNNTTGTVTIPKSLNINTTTPGDSYPLIVRNNGLGLGAAFSNADLSKNVYIHPHSSLAENILWVEGSTRIDGVIRNSANSSGSSGQVLTSQGAGAWTWTTPSATGVTNVTATSPLFSSGGTTPNITIQTASAAQSGALSSANWTTFNNKLGGSGTTGYFPYFNGSNSLADSPLYRASATQMTLGTTGVTNLLGRSGFNIMAADPAFVIGKSTTHYWYQYLNGNNFELYNPNFGAVALWQTDGKLKMGKYAGSGNRYLYASSTGEINVSLYDAASTSGTGTNGYIPRYFNATTFDRTGLYCTADGGNNFGIGTTTPNTYGITSGGGLAIYNATDPRLSLANTSNTWINYLSSGAYRIFSNAFGDVVELTSNGRMGINKASPSTRLHVGGDLTVDTRTGTGTSVAMYDASGKLCTATLGSALSISSGTINVTSSFGAMANGSITSTSFTSTPTKVFNLTGTVQNGVVTYDSALDRFTVSAAGTYEITFKADCESTGSGFDAALRVYKNGTTAAGVNGTTYISETQPVVGNSIISLAASDYIELWSGGGGTGTANCLNVTFTIKKLD